MKSSRLCRCNKNFCWDLYIESPRKRVKIKEEKNHVSINSYVEVYTLLQMAHILLRLLPLCETRYTRPYTHLLPIIEIDCCKNNMNNCVSQKNLCMCLKSSQILSPFQWYRVIYHIQIIIRITKTEDPKGILIHVI